MVRHVHHHYHHRRREPLISNGVMVWMFAIGAGLMALNHVARIIGFVVVAFCVLRYVVPFVVFVCIDIKNHFWPVPKVEEPKRLR